MTSPATHDFSRWSHDHVFDSGNRSGERNTWRVAILSAVMMAVEIVAGWLTGSMALLADGWHMSTHVAALGITAGAYLFARRYALDRRFTFGTWKIEVLGGFASAVILAIVGLFMITESFERLLAPIEIQYNEALTVAVIGLVVNLVSAVLLDAHSHHGHDHDHDEHNYDEHNHDEHNHDDHRHDVEHVHHDVNLRAAYMHVVADAMTSVLAIIALVVGKFIGWSWLDAVIGMVGAIIVLAWSVGLMRETGRILLDKTESCELPDRVRQTLEADGRTHLYDLHVWRVGRKQYACIASLVACEPKEPDEYRRLLKTIPSLVHITIEASRCLEHTALATDSRISST